MAPRDAAAGSLSCPRNFPRLRCGLRVGGSARMAQVSRRTLEWIYSLILLTIVLLSWGYVIYATRIAAKWQLKEDYPAETKNL
ncbi:small integral membrane protein 27 [Lacerta agilis]|uniref:small integral membrane protein 27 n=1 Tax=Lacerta agilis TaxID=80427 RepID=UPI0014197B84|nr:small integral membrane protein 27 [Lacerta agilis]